MEKNIELLWAAMMWSEDENLAPRLKGKTKLPEIIDTLSALEKEVTDMGVHRAIALLKAVIGGKRKEEDFTLQCHKIAGMV